MVPGDKQGNNLERISWEFAFPLGKEVPPKNLNTQKECTMKKKRFLIGILVTVAIMATPFAAFAHGGSPPPPPPPPTCGEGEIEIEPAVWVPRQCTCEVSVGIHGTIYDVSQFYIKPTGDDNHCHRIVWHNLSASQQGAFKAMHMGNYNWGWPNHGSWSAAYNYHIPENPLASCTPGYWIPPICEPIPEEPVYGCTDPEALNYNPEATVDDGSCEYQVPEEPTPTPEPEEPTPTPEPTPVPRPREEPATGPEGMALPIAEGLAFLVLGGLGTLGIRRMIGKK